MPSIRNNGADDALLDAARQCLLQVGWKRSTLTDVARRAGVSRMTIYRRWPDMQTLLADLMTREWSGVIEETTLPAGSSTRERLARATAATVSALRTNELFRKIVEVDPELLLPYVLDRRGRTQDSMLGLLETLVADGQEDGSVRTGDPVLLARSMLLASYGFTLSAHTMVDDGVLDVADLDDQLRLVVDRYLAP